MGMYITTVLRTLIFACTDLSIHIYEGISALCMYVKYHICTHKIDALQDGIKV